LSPAFWGRPSRLRTISPDRQRSGFRNIRFDELVAAYNEALGGLADGGADLILLETIFDTLNARRGVRHRDPVRAARAAARASSCRGPSPTSPAARSPADARGLLELGEPRQADRGGPELRLGAKLMRPYIEELSNVADTYISCYPNAGLPNPLSETGYDETPIQPPAC